MAEPRMRARTKGSQFPSSDLEAFLFAYGDDYKPLPETVKLLDEMITDYIIELCHEAAICATYSHRAKIKLDDFKFALRKDPVKLGRGQELLSKKKQMDEVRKVTSTEEAEIAKNEEKREKKRRKIGN